MTRLTDPINCTLFFYVRNRETVPCTRLTDLSDLRLSASGDITR